MSLCMVELGMYRTLGAASAKNDSKNRCQNFEILLAFFAEYNINYFSKLPKSEKFYFSL
jgi:hypothetical protein